MKPDRKLIILAWVLFVITFGASIVLTALKSAGAFKEAGQYLSFLGPLSFLVGAMASRLTSAAIYRADEPASGKSGVSLEVVGAFCNGFAFWFLAMFVLSLIGVVARPLPANRRVLELIADCGALIVYLYGWLRARSFSWRGLLLSVPFLFMVVKSLLKFWQS